MSRESEPDIELLTDQADRLATEVKVLRESVDELHTSLEWAIRNARLTLQFDDAARRNENLPASPTQSKSVSNCSASPGVDSPTPEPGKLF